MRGILISEISNWEISFFEVKKNRNLLFKDRGSTCTKIFSFLFFSFPPWEGLKFIQHLFDLASFEVASQTSINGHWKFMCCNTFFNTNLGWFIGTWCGVILQSPTYQVVGTCNYIGKFLLEFSCSTRDPVKWTIKTQLFFFLLNDYDFFPWLVSYTYFNPQSHPSPCSYKISY